MRMWAKRRTAMLATVGAVVLGLTAPALAAPPPATPPPATPPPMPSQPASSFSASGVSTTGVVAAWATAASTVTPSRARKPLAGITIALDPGHQLGNSNPAHFAKLAKTRFNGTTVKGCNTSGTATNGGYPEATFVWNVSRFVKKRLQRLGAKVRLTRKTNSYDSWGPCVWKRGKFGAKVGADLLLSVHADGAAPTARGFFVIVPAVVPGWTDDIAAVSRRYGQRMIDGMAAAGATPANYINGQMLVWDNITTLNFSDVPAVLVEVGNMRNSAEAGFMVTTKGQRAHAKWLVAGVRAALNR